MPRYRLVAVDLDETLLGEDHRVSPGNYDAVQRLKAAGVEVVIASGRMHENTTSFAQELGLGGPIVSYNGAMVKELSSGEVYYHMPLPSQHADAIVDYANEHGHHLNYYLDDCLYVREKTKWSDLYSSRTGSIVHPVGDLVQFRGRTPTKIILLDSPDMTGRLLKEMADRWRNELYVTITNPEYLEFMCAGVSKAVGLAAIGERLGIGAQDMAAFGDSYNDIPMLRYCGLGVAMGNAHDEVKRSADQVAPRHSEDGFALAVEKWVLN
ncbi:MAG TPA: Cof-type HAD-IIB family hydrolase [Armatimonadota bacterium]